MAEEVHIFLDQFFPKYHITHRRLLHQRLGVALAVKKFGEKAWGPAERHIVDDLGCVPDTWLDILFALRSDGKLTQEQMIEQINISINCIYAFSKLYNKIYLRLNPKEHNKLISLLNTMCDIPSNVVTSALTKSSLEEMGEIINKNTLLIITESQEIPKHEWKRVKKGELPHRIIKYGVPIIVFVLVCIGIALCLDRLNPSITFTSQ
ncbi:MAG: hypothetical protein P4L55_05465 [Syntrophobacteraceae bacterium]|nr:hypothetical protein [Syntrophobacteraceae bacterium]